MKPFCLALLICCLSDCYAETPQIKAIIFDFGGVIATKDSELIVDFVSKSLESSPEDAIALLKELHAHKESGGDDIDWWNDYLDSLGYEYSLKRLWLRQWDRVKSLSIKEIPGMLDLVQQLQEMGYRTPLFSNVSETLAESVCKAGYYDYFDPLYLSYQMNFEKPDPQSYQIVLDDLQLDPEACLFIDDRPENVDAARKLGIDSVHFINPAQLIQEMKKRHIEVGETHVAA